MSMVQIREANDYTLNNQRLLLIFALRIKLFKTNMRSIIIKFNQYNYQSLIDNYIYLIINT
jgi:hypothetical protein